MGYRVLAAVILTAHFAYLGYVLLGGFLAWRWPRSIRAHLVAVGWAGTVVVADLVAGGVGCPLTSAEDWARRRAGQPGLTVGFIDRYLEGVLYPQRYAAMVQLLVGALVLASWLGYLRRRDRPALRRRDGPALRRRDRPALRRRDGPALRRRDGPAVRRRDRPSAARRGQSSSDSTAAASSQPLEMPHSSS